ncbi:hypothetical protein [Streptomyces fulvoviolaceus]|uniref:hypothetical protein n=1 Tax=Streptomyces fulvoviolaceus TaxID=285535 RepID=UPI0018FED27E|nr:hypothetical protein [Streptomyces fulvoviolaceus]
MSAVSEAQPVPVPVPNFGEPGTRDSHWRDAVFVNELISPFISGSNNPLSRMTTAGLGDLGYQVGLDDAEPYTLPDLLQSVWTPTAHRATRRRHHADRRAHPTACHHTLTDGTLPARAGAIGVAGCEGDALRMMDWRPTNFSERSPTHMTTLPTSAGPWGQNEAFPG